MPIAELTLSFSGTVTLREFTEQMRYFQELVNALTSEFLEGQRLRWIISELEGGSASASVGGEVDSPEIAERIEMNYLQVAEYVQNPHQTPMTLPESVVRPARAIARALNGDIKEVRFEAHGEVVDIVSPAARLERPPRVGAYGSLRGVIETLSSHNRLRFTLYEALRGVPIRCYFTPDLVEQVRSSWDHHVQVDGWVVRDEPSGRPIEVQRVRKITVLDTGEGSDFRTAIGAIPWKEGMPTAEEAIRQSRDG